MTRSEHQRLEELMAVHALGGLDPDGCNELVEEMASHGTACESCRRLFTEYSEVAVRLALLMDPVPVSQEEEDRLMEAARAHPPSRLADSEPQLKVIRGSGAPSRAGRRRPLGAARWLTAAAVAAALLAGSWAVGYSLGSGDKQAQAQFIAFASTPGTRVVGFPNRGRQRLAVAFRPGAREAWVLGTNLAEPPEGKVYELWFQPQGSKSIRPAGTFSPDDGIVLTRSSVASSVVALAVSVEPEGGSSQPTAEPVFNTTVR